MRLFKWLWAYSRFDADFLRHHNIYFPALACKAQTELLKMYIGP